MYELVEGMITRNTRVENSSATLIKLHLYHYVLNRICESFMETVRHLLSIVATIRRSILHPRRRLGILCKVQQSLIFSY